MWNFAALDTSSTINRQAYFQTGVTPKPSSIATKTRYPVIPFRPNFFPPANTRDFGPICAPEAPMHTHPHHIRTPGDPQSRPHPPPRCPPATPHPHPRRPAGYAPLPTPKSHVIPPGPHSPVARKPRNINDLISKPETPSGELRAKLLGSARVSPHRGHRAQAATHPDR